MEAIILSIVIGITGGLIAAFYRNTLKPKNMIFNGIFDILEMWVFRARAAEHPSPAVWLDRYSIPQPRQRFLGNWLAYQLGYCIYCSATWMTAILYVIITKGVDIWIILALAIQHAVVVVFCVFILPLDPALKYDRRFWSDSDREERGLKTKDND